MIGPIDRGFENQIASQLLIVVQYFNVIGCIIRVKSFINFTNLKEEPPIANGKQI